VRRGRAGGVDPLVVDVAVIEQRNVVVDLNPLAEMLQPEYTLNDNHHQQRLFISQKLNST
jgi:hypothetical protein